MLILRLKRHFVDRTTYVPLSSHIVPGWITNWLSSYHEVYGFMQVLFSHSSYSFTVFQSYSHHTRIAFSRNALRVIKNTVHLITIIWAYFTLGKLSLLGIFHFGHLSLGNFHMGKFHLGNFRSAKNSFFINSTKCKSYSLYLQDSNIWP